MSILLTITITAIVIKTGHMQAIQKKT